MPVRVAIAGVGNCASTLLQGIEYYRRRKDGLWHRRVGGLSPKDVRVVAAFEIDSTKVGLDLADAVGKETNVASKVVKVPRYGVSVAPGAADGQIPPHLSGKAIATSDKASVARALEEAKADVLLNIISSGSDRASRTYAEACLEAGCSYANCTPSLILKNRALVSKFRSTRLAIVGDDLMSQLGSTVFHRGILKLMVERGMRLVKSYQLDVGGGSETFNTIDEEIRMAKRKVKTGSVVTEVPYDFETVTGTTDYVDYMRNDRTSYFWLEANGFLNLPVTLDVYLKSADGPNAGNILLDVVRAVSASVRSGNYGAVQEICAYAFKSPPRPVHYDEAYSSFRKAFVR